MDDKIIEGIIISPLRQIEHPKGDILLCVKKSDSGFVGFGEVYISKLNFGEIKGWNKHLSMTLNLVVPVGEVAFVIYDGRENSKTKNKFYSVIVSEKKYQRLTISPGLWLAFKGLHKPTSYILNVTDIEHSNQEIEKVSLDQIQYDWRSFE